MKRALIDNKGKIFPVLNEALRHEGIWAGSKAPQHSHPNHCINVSGQLHTWATATPGKELSFK
jgi:hypothetical protein